MKVQAIAKGFYGGEPRHCGEKSGKGDLFTLEARSDEFIKKQRKDASSKDVSNAERKADIEAQFSDKWMERV